MKFVEGNETNWMLINGELVAEYKGMESNKSTKWKFNCGVNGMNKAIELNGWLIYGGNGTGAPRCRINFIFSFHKFHSKIQLIAYAPLN